MGHEERLDAQATEFKEAAGAINDICDRDPGTEPITDAAYEEWLERNGLAPGQKRYFPQFDDGPGVTDAAVEPQEADNVVQFPTQPSAPATHEDEREAA